MNELADDQRLTQIYLKLNSVMEQLTEIIALLEADGECVHENKQDTTTMGAMNKSFFCRDCREEFIIVMDDQTEHVQ